MIAATQAFFVLGVTHREAPLDVREQFALEPEEALELQTLMRKLPAIKELLILNTCNRLEVYGIAEDLRATEALAALFCERHGVPKALFEAYSFFRSDLKAIQHLLEVASGIDSQMVGETEILGQIKTAYLNAREAQTTGPILSRLFERSFQAAKAARSGSEISTGQISIGNIAVELATRIFGKLGKSQVLMLGSGEVAEKTVQALKSRGAASITVTSRRFEKARTLAHQFGGSAIDFEDFDKQLFNFDIVVGSTAAPRHILTVDMVRQALRRRNDEPMFFIDLAVPRDIEPAVETLENIYRYDLEDLSKIANENLSSRKGEIDHIRTHLSRAAWNIWLQLRRRF